MEYNTTSSREVFDYIVVGAGSAGSVIADRLSADGVSTVCVLEAGGWDHNPLIHIPAGFVKLIQDPRVIWPFESDPSQNVAGRSIKLPQGRVVGGSSSINGMVYNRGQRADYDNWEALGNRGWSYANVLPYFKRSERRVGASDPTFRGHEGSLPVTNHDWQNFLCDAFIDGVVNLGIPRSVDYNGTAHEGVGYYQRVIERGWRVSAARAFLSKAKSRRNVEIRVGCQVSRVLFKGRTASGVDYFRGDPAATQSIQARREIILCAGTINTAKLLQLSGVGPRDLLAGLGIDIVADLPGVGANLRDHYAVRMIARARNVQTINEHARGLRLGIQIARWLVGAPSILALVPSLVHVFARTRDNLPFPDLQFVFTPGSYRVGKVYQLDRYPGLTCGFAKMRPESTGTVKIRQRDVRALPSIQTNYLGAESDQLDTVAGLKLVRKFISTPELRPYLLSETLPGPAVVSDDELLQFAREYGITSFHLVGTAKMGPADDSSTVVDDELNVHGIQNLRVADASIMPMIVSANTYAATLMIAEKAADLIRGVTPPAPESLTVEQQLI